MERSIFNINSSACSQEVHNKTMAGGVGEEWDVVANFGLMSLEHFDFISLRVTDAEVIVFKRGDEVKLLVEFVNDALSPLGEQYINAATLLSVSVYSEPFFDFLSVKYSEV